MMNELLRINVAQLQPSFSILVPGMMWNRDSKLKLSNRHPIKEETPERASKIKILFTKY
jgi:hypothetical protein